MVQKEVHCRWCGKPFFALKEEENKTWVLRSRNYYYHKDCFEAFLNRKNTDRSNDQWLDLLVNLITYDLKGRYDYFKIKSQWLNLLNENKTGKGCYFTAYYAFIIKKIEYQSIYGIGIIKCLYDEAVNYWIQQEQINKGIMDQIAKAKEVFAGEQKIIKRKKHKDIDEFIDWDSV